MKKKGIITISIIILLLLVTTGCNLAKKESITTEDFKSKMQAKNFVIQDVKETQFIEVTEIQKATIAIEEGYKYQIEFYELTDANAAKTLYDRNKLIFESNKGSSSAYTNVDINNYNKYTLKTDGQYKVVVRIDNTLIYLNVNQEYESNVKSILKELGY